MALRKPHLRTKLSPRKKRLHSVLKKLIRRHQESLKPCTPRPRWTEQLILDLLKQKPELTGAEIVASISANEGTVRSAISRLFNQGKIAITTPVGERRKYTFAEKQRVI